MVKKAESKNWYRFKDQDQEEGISKEVKQEQLLDDIRRDKIFGFVK